MMKPDLDQTAQELFNLLPVFHRKLIRSFWVHGKTSLSPMQLHVLCNLQDKDASTMTEIAREICVSRQQMTPIIDKLITIGYIKREHDEVDRRNIKLSITACGKQYLENHRRDKVRLLEEKLRFLPDADLQTLNTAIKDLHQIMNKLP